MHSIRITAWASTVALATACSGAPGSAGAPGPEAKASIAAEAPAVASPDLAPTAHFARLPRAHRRATGGPFADDCSSAPHLKYHGGPVIQSLRIVSVLWGALTDPNDALKLPSFYTDLTSAKSSYLDTLTQYKTGPKHTGQKILHGSYQSQVQITPSVCPGTSACTVTDAQIQAELASQIAAGVLPAPEDDAEGYARTFYLFEFPADDTITFAFGGSTSTSCVDYCAYHDWTTIDTKRQPYGVVADFASGPCNTSCVTEPSEYFDDVTSVHSYVLANAMTDPDIALNSSDTGYAHPAAWADDACGEIADICNFQEQDVDLDGTTWTVQQIWSNAANDCVADGT